MIFFGQNEGKLVNKIKKTRNLNKQEVSEKAWSSV